MSYIASNNVIMMFTSEIIGTTTATISSGSNLQIQADIVHKWLFATKTNVSKFFLVNVSFFSQEASALSKRKMKVFPLLTCLQKVNWHVIKILF